VINLVGALFWHPNVGSLLVAQLCEFNTQGIEVKPRHFLIQVLGQHVNAEGGKRLRW